MAVNQISYLELPASNISELQPFYRQLFGWTYQDFGPDYSTVHGSGLEVGINGDSPSRSKAPLAMIETNSIEEMQRRVEAAGGQITIPIFQYPGGLRFHFVDPSGNELAIFQIAGDESR